MNEEQKALIAELQKGVAESILEPVTKAAVEKIREEMSQVVQASMPKSEVEKQKELKEQAVKYFTGVVNNDREMVRGNSKAAYGNVGTAGEGGNIAPEYFENNIIEIANVNGLVRQRATNIPLPGKKVTWPTGGSVEAFKVTEGSTIKARKPAFGNFSMEPEKLGLIIPVSRELIEDSSLIPGLMEYLNRIAGRAFAKLEDAMGLGLAGSSAGEGVLKKSGVPVHTIAGTTFSSITFEELLEAQGDLDENVRDGAEYIMSRSIEDQLRKKTFAISSDKIGFIWGNPVSGQPRTLWDLPVNRHPDMPKNGDSAVDTKFIALVNWEYMYFGDRRAYAIEQSTVASIVGTDDSTELNAFTQDLVFLKFTERIDIELAQHTKAFSTVKTAAY